jgi:hypothetical protein
MKIDFDHENQHVRCMAHIINLSVQSLLYELKGLPIHNSEMELIDPSEEGRTIRKVIIFFLFFNI